jgi:hypothetical protein
MKTSEAERNGGKCPECQGQVSQDLKKKGFVRHLERNIVGEKVPRNKKDRCRRYGLGDRD